MPDDYYVSQYSGEEIDALLGGAGTGTVRYDAAQSLTDEQKTQARANINAAPDGFGYGSTMSITFWDDTDGSKLKAFLEDKYMTYRGSIIRTNLVDYPICKVAGNGGWADIFFDNDPNSKTIVVRYYTVTRSIIGPSVATLMCKGNVWGEWEYENPPMVLGIEYRTTERYQEKPVYVMTKDYGLVQEKNTPKSESIPENAGYGWVVNGLVTYYGIPIPSWNDDGSLRFGAQYQYGSDKIIFIANENRVHEDAKYLLTIKYVKTTD